MAIATITSTEGAERITCEPGKSVECTFTIRNDLDRLLQVSLLTIGGSPFAVALVGAVERDLAPGTSDQISVRITASPEVTPGQSVSFHVEAYDRTAHERRVSSSPITVMSKEVALPPPPPPPPPNGKTPWWVWLLVGVGAILVLGVGGFFLYRALSGGIEVPALAGKSVAEAEGMLSALQLKLGEVDKEVSETLAPTLIIRSDPAAGDKLKEEGAVNLTLAVAPPVVPRLVGQTVEKAADLLESLGLTIGEVSEEVTAAQATDTVVRTQPGQGSKLAIGDAVDLVFAAAPPPAQTTCADAVQNKIAWDYNGTKRWASTNVNNLCRGQEGSREPANCFKKVMHGGVSWTKGNKSTKWNWKNAISLCQGSPNSGTTVNCFEGQISAGVTWEKAIAKCNGRPVQVFQMKPLVLKYQGILGQSRAGSRMVPPEDD